MRKHLTTARAAKHRRAPWKNGTAAAIACFVLVSCAKLSEIAQGPDAEPSHLPVIASAPANFDLALRENQTALHTGKIAPDVALYNAGFMFAHTDNPRRDPSKAVHSFQALVATHPRSPLVEPAKSWIQVLQQQQKITDERRKLAEEKRALEKEREMLAQERQRLNYASEKSRQLDLEIEKRRRQTLSK